MSSSDGNEYVIAPWGDGDDHDCDVEIMTVQLPSRELTAQLEVPQFMLDRTKEISDAHGIAVETALAERLELNRSRGSLLAARTVTSTTDTREHLEDARGYLTGVEYLATDELEDAIAAVWMDELD